MTFRWRCLAALVHCHGMCMALHVVVGSCTTAAGAASCDLCIHAGEAGTICFVAAEAAPRVQGRAPRLICVQTPCLITYLHASPASGHPAS